MSVEQFSLRWNNFQNSILTNLESLKCDEDLVDVTLMCEGKSVKAHKLVLSACSSYFKNVFKENPCAHPIIILKGFSFADVTSLISFMYQGEVHIAQDKLESFLGTAELLEVRGLADVPPPNIAELNKIERVARNDVPEHCSSPKALSGNLSSTHQNPQNPIPVEADAPTTSTQIIFETPESVQPSSTPVETRTDVKSLHSGESATPPESENGECEDIEEWKPEESDWRRIIPKEEPMEDEVPDPLSLRERITSDTSQPFDWHHLSGSDSSNQNLSIQNPGPRFLENSNLSIAATSRGAPTKGGWKKVENNRRREVPEGTKMPVVVGDYRKPHKCPFCNGMYSNYFNMKQHCINVHFPGKVKCDICLKMCKNKWYLRKHMVRSHNAPLVFKR